MQKPLNAVLATVGLAIAIALFPVEPATAEWNKRTLVIVKRGLDAFWGSYLGDLGVRYRSPRVYLLAQAEPTPCGEIDFTAYCPETNIVYLDMREMSQMAFEFGDSAAYFALAHEYGHSVQNHLGLLNRGIPTRDLELQADCLAGVFFAGSKYAKILEPGDLEEGRLAAFINGDGDYWAPDHHGTPRERREAFTMGFTNPRACFF